MRPHSKASVSIPPRSPWALCDRCKKTYDKADLSWNFDWRGNTLANTRLLVCDTCKDIPQEQLRVIVIGPDPMPVMNARPPNYAIDESDFRTTSGQDAIDPQTGIPVPGKTKRITQNDANRVTQPTGAPPGSLNTTPGTDPNAPGNDDPGLPYGFETTPTTE